jgi:hypothetical protein
MSPVYPAELLQKRPVSGAAGNGNRPKVGS